MTGGPWRPAVGDRTCRSPIQWLSDNGSIYTALDTLCTAERLGLVPITTPAASPQSNGMSEAFVNTIKRDYVAGADRSSAAKHPGADPRVDRGLQAVAPALGARLSVTPAVSQPSVRGRSHMLAHNPAFTKWGKKKQRIPFVRIYFRRLISLWSE